MVKTIYWLCPYAATFTSQTVRSTRTPARTKASPFSWPLVVPCGLRRRLMRAVGRNRMLFSCNLSSWSQPRSAMVSSLVSSWSSGQARAARGVAVGLLRCGQSVDVGSVQCVRSIDGAQHLSGAFGPQSRLSSGSWCRAGRVAGQHRLSHSHTPHSVWLRSPSGRVGVRRSLFSGGVWLVVHHSGHPVQRCAPNPRFERTAEKRRFSVPRRLRRRAASQASR
jgi:hypothetical protein